MLQGFKISAAKAAKLTRASATTLASARRGPTGMHTRQRNRTGNERDGSTSTTAISQFLSTRF
jgi:hypothetical protein